MDWRDGLTDEIVKLERAAQADEHAFYYTARHAGAERAAGLARLLQTYERRAMKCALGGTLLK